jgi:hypothetical protein
MKKHCLVTMMLFYCSFSSFSQNKESNSYTQNSFFAEIGGPGIGFSANFDCRFKPSSFGFGARIGIGFIIRSTPDSLERWNESFLPRNAESIGTIPLQLNYIFGKQGSPHTFEVGAGLTFLTKKAEIKDFKGEGPTITYGTVCFMYRRIPVKGGFSWRIGITPHIAKNLICPSAGVSIGYNF